MTLKGRSAIVLLAALAAAASTARLGVWQLDRAGQKIALQEALRSRRAMPPLPAAELARDAAQAAAQQHRSITLLGRWGFFRKIAAATRAATSMHRTLVVEPRR